MATLTADCKLKGCKIIWACINDNSGAIEPIGCITAATLNSAEEDGDNAGKFGGGLATNQVDALATDTDEDGNVILADNETRFQIPGDPNFYESCSASNSGCIDTLNLTADYCFEKGCQGNDASSAANQRKLVCGGEVTIAMYKLNPNGSLEEMWRGNSAKVTSKNRTFASGQDSDHTFDITIESKDSDYSACFH